VGVEIVINRKLGIQLWSALVLACSVQLLMEFWPDYFWSVPGYAAYDLAAKTFSDTHVTITPEKRIILVAIDEQSYKYLGTPSLTPNRAIATLIDRVAVSSPVAILVDIDIAHELDKKDGEALKDVLQAYPTKGDAPLILVREYTKDNRILSTKYDTVISENPKLFWASSIVKPDSDGIVRGYQDTGFCEVSENAFPSTVSIFSQFYSQRDSQNLSEPSVQCKPADKSRRFLYSFTDELEEGTRRATTTVNGIERPVFQKISALSLLGKEELHTGFLAGSIIVIGNTHIAARDTHLSPLGDMPGATILANAIYSEVAFGTIQTLPLWQSLLLVCVMTIIPVAIFAGHHMACNQYPDTLGLLSSPTWPALLVSTLLFLAWYLVSPWALFNRGIWIDLVAPQVVVAIWLEVFEVWSLTTEVKNLRRKLKSLELKV